MKISIIYHSESGSTKNIADLMEQKLNSMNNIEAKSMSYDSYDEEFTKDSKAFIFGAPTYGGTASCNMLEFLSKTKIDFADKLGASFSTARYVGGGSSFSCLTIAGVMLVRGMLVYSGGAVHGAPVTHFGACSVANDETQIQRAIDFAERIGIKMLELF